MKRLIKLFLILLFANAFIISAQAQEREILPLKIKTNHPDLKVKIQRCDVSGDIAILEFLLENISDNDVNFYLSVLNVALYDDEGNKYTKVYQALGKNKLSTMDISSVLGAGVPIKLRLQVEGIEESATIFRRCDIGIFCNDFNMNWDKPIKIQNIPINRDGE